MSRTFRRDFLANLLLIQESSLNIGKIDMLSLNNIEVIRSDVILPFKGVCLVLADRVICL